MGQSFTRKVNGITCTYFDRHGVPYSALDRRWLEIVTTLAKRQWPNPRIEFGSVSQALAKYGMERTGGKRGNILSARKALEKIASLHVSSGRSADAKGLIGHQGMDFSLSRKHQVLWARGRTDLVEPELFDSENFMELSEDFMGFIKNAAPHVQEHYMSIRSPLTLDVYNWLVMKLYDLRSEELIRWAWLYAQFGPTGGMLSDAQMKDLRVKLKNSLLDIVTHYYLGARVRAVNEGLVLLPSPRLIEPDSKKAGFSLT